MARTNNDPAWVRAGIGILLVALTGYGAYLRAHDLGASLYDTEILARERVEEGYVYLLMHSAVPLYDVLVKGCLLLGDTEAVLRLPSVLAGLLTILTAYGLLRYLHSRTAGLVAAALVTFNAYLINLSSYASPEALLALCALAAAWSLCVVLETRRWYGWIGFLVFGSLAVGPAATFIPVLAAMFLGSAVYLVLNRSVGGAIWRGFLVLLLGVCAAAGPLWLLQRGHDPRNTYQIDTAAFHAAGDTLAPNAEEHPRGGGQAIQNAGTETVRYRLTRFDCAEYLKRYFWHTTSWLWVALIVVGVWGMADLLYRRPAAGLVFTFGAILGPLALFAVSAAHPYHFRDFSYLAVFSTVMVSAGACVMPRFVSRLLGAPRSLRIWKRLAPPPGEKLVTAANALYVLLAAGLAAPLAPVINAAFQSYPVYGYLPLSPGPRNHAPVSDWQNLFALAGPVTTPDDVFVFMEPEGGHGPKYGRYYLRRWQPGAAPGPRPELRFGAPTPDLLQELAEQHPNGNFWFIGSMHNRVKDYEKFFTVAGGKYRDFMLYNTVDGLRLYWLGATNTNYAVDGDFEKGWLGELPAGVAKSKDYPFDGLNALRIAVPPEAMGAEAFAQIRVAPEGYRLRNNGFGAWKEERPVAWTPNAAAGSAVFRVPEGFKHTVSLGLHPTTETAIVQQTLPVPLAPGRTLMVQAMGRCETPNSLHLVVRYRGPDYEAERQLVHPGDGQWILMEASIDIPADADPNAITFEVWRTPGGEGDAIMDNVELAIKDLGSRLDPSRTYTVSMMARAQGLSDAQGSQTAPVGRTRLFWKAPDGTEGRTDLFPIHNQDDWTRLQAAFRPGQDIPFDIDELYVETGIANGTGSIWIDDVQVEAGDRASLFAREYWLPQDETLGGLDLTPFAVEKPW